MINRRLLVWACWCVLAWKMLPAQVKHVKATGQGTLKMVVILSRHGVRSPTWTQDRLDSYSAAPWPKWGVAPGDLTSRGYTLMKQFGSFDRSSLAGAGLISAHGCEDALRTYLWADTDERTVASGKALAEGLFPGCAPAVHQLAAGEDDLLFHPAADGVSPAEAETAFVELTARTKQLRDAQQGELLREMQRVFWGCPPNAACTPSTNSPMTSLQGGPLVVVRGKGDHIVDLDGPLAQASTFAEDLLLEYADGMPMNDVGWGRVDELQLRRFLTLHSDYFDLMHRTPDLARLEASNMLFHITQTLGQAVEQKPAKDAIGPLGSKLVILSGHDTNLAGIAALLGLHWTLDGRDDDTPPGMELTFELWQDAGGVYSIRVTAAMQTLHQLRDMAELTPAAPPARVTLTLPGCAAEVNACRWTDFERIANAAIGRSSVFPLRLN